MLKRRAARLARCFQLVTASLGVPCIWIACTKADPPRAAAKGASSISDDDQTPPPPDIVVSDARINEAETSCWASISAFDAGSDREEICHYELPCGLANEGLTATGCQVVPMQADGAPDDANGSGLWNCVLVEGKGCTDGSYTPTDAQVVFECVGCPSGGGRRPAGMRLERSRGATAVGAYFADLAQLEAASVHAFLLLAAELALHGAPSELVRAARASARDERRHAAAMARLARRYGGVPSAPRVRQMAARSLRALARENAIEGCVRETFGALLNAWQASHARDPEVRAIMAGIAEDELAHAALSWEIAHWADRTLSASARRSVARARRRAVARLVAMADREASPALRAFAGLPTRADARGLARGLAERLWAA